MSRTVSAQRKTPFPEARLKLNPDVTEFPLSNEGLLVGLWALFGSLVMFLRVL